MGTLVEDLCQPGNHPEPRPSSVSLATTHASWVFLTDRDAWKVKRPVDYGFLDFTTLDKRRHFCHEEVRLNGRLAPGVYLGVVPVRLDGRGHSLDRGGEIVDYAVRMRRLPDAASALSMTRAGTLDRAGLDGLARRLAGFYAREAASAEGGSLEIVRANVLQNFVQVERFVGSLVDPADFAAVRSWQERFLSTHASRFEERTAAGRIREGHGDLRLEHVYFLPEGVRVIDCIDFNASFRIGDPASDVAFLAMDLDHEQRPDLGAWFLARFAMAANDYDLYGVVDLYLGYRAWVRGKVACFVVADPSTPEDKRRRKAEEARTYFALAQACTKPCQEIPRLLAVGGLVGTGKSTLAEALSAALGYPVVGSDPTRKFLAGLAAEERGPERIYSPEFSRRTFDELFRRAGVVLESGRGVILDGTFGRRELRQRARQLAARHSVPFLFVEARCDEATARDRLRRREAGPSVSDARESLYERMRSDFEPATEVPARETLAVNTTRSPEDLTEEVLAHLRTGAV